MDIILCHTTADFDTLGAAVGLARLRPGSRIVLTGGSHPTVRDFLALHRDEYGLIERRSVNRDQIRSLAVVDTQWRDRLGKAAEWLDLPVDITVYDHHLNNRGDIAATHRQVEPVGATTTLMAEQLQAQQLSLTVAEATVMALGIHVDTGSLTFDQTTVRDAAALTWLMEQGASVRAIATYVEPGLSNELQDTLAIALATLTTETHQGYTLAWVLLPLDDYVPGLSTLASRLLSLTEADILLVAARYPAGETDERLTVIGRSRAGVAGVNLGALFQSLGGGGHPRAAAIALRGVDPDHVLATLRAQLLAQLPQPLVARELMSSPVRTIRPETTIAEAQRLLLRYGHSGLSVVDERGQLLGVISRRDLDIALHHGFSHAPVKGYMTTDVRTITPQTPLSDIEAMMVTYDIGRLPVLAGEQLVGIVTRTDLLRQLHADRDGATTRWLDGETCPWGDRPPAGFYRDRLSPALLSVLTKAAQQAEQQGWQLYLVGGAVRDLLLGRSQAHQDERAINAAIDDIDLVVDGVQPQVDQVSERAAGVELAHQLQQLYPQARLQVHGRFQTAALLWHNDPDLDSLWIDIATARTEFYPYPAANPEVEASSIRQDLYRRDFTINAMAIRLTGPNPGELLDFAGGLLDLDAQHIRVLHPNSFIEDPTRIYRAVRFAVRLGFQIHPQTEGYIRHAIASGIYRQIQTEMAKTPALQTRLKQELHYILQAPYWPSALRLLDDLGALCCIHDQLTLTPTLWWQLRLVDRWLKRFDPEASLPHWQLLLELMLIQLPPPDRWLVANHLQLPADSIQRLQDWADQEAMMAALAPAGEPGTTVRPSQIAATLRPCDRPTLILLAATQPRAHRRLIWRYLTQWQTVRAPLDGHDLQELGYKPGKQFKAILTALLAATLDGEVGDRSSAEQFLADHFPV